MYWYKKIIAQNWWLCNLRIPKILFELSSLKTSNYMNKILTCHSIFIFFKTELMSKINFCEWISSSGVFKFQEQTQSTCKSFGKHCNQWLPIGLQEEASMKYCLLCAEIWKYSNSSWYNKNIDPLQRWVLFWSFKGRVLSKNDDDHNQ